MDDIYICDCCGFIQKQEEYTGICPVCNSPAFKKESNPPNARIAKLFAELNLLRTLSDRVRFYMSNFPEDESKPVILTEIEELLNKHTEKF